MSNNEQITLLDKHVTVQCESDEEGCHRCREHFPRPRMNSEVDMVSIHEEMDEEVPGLEPGGVPASIVSLSCLNFGVGMFVFPTVFTELGILLGALTLVGFTILSDLGMMALYTLAERFQLSSYEDIMTLAFGRPGRLLISAFIATTATMGNAGHMQFVTQLVKDMFVWFCTGDAEESNLKPGVRAIMIAAFGVLMLPFCFARTLNSLRYMSTATVIFVMSLVLVCTFYAFRQIAENGAQNTNNLFNLASGPLLDGAPVVAFAFSGVINFCHVYNEAKDKSRIPFCIHVGQLISCVFYLIVATAGALAFKSPATDYLYSFPPDNYVITCMCVGLVVVIVLIYPVVNFPAVCAIDALLFPSSVSSVKRRRLYSVLLLVVILLLDVAIPNVKLVFGLGGSLGLGMVAYGLPGAALLFLLSRPYIDSTSGEKVEPGHSIWGYVAGVVLLLFGLVLAFGSTARILYLASQ